MRKIIFAEGEIYHIYNRGANKCDVFLDEQDRARFTADLWLMNSRRHKLNIGHLLARNLFLREDEGALLTSNEGAGLVDIAGFVLMSNHFHLLVKQRISGGISVFMQKLGTAYTMYFNKKYRHSGVLFQGVFASRMIDDDAYFDEIPLYIHANPLKLAGPFQSVDAEMRYLAAYKWSSFCDYFGTGGQYKHLLNRDILEDYFIQKGGFEPSMRAYLLRKRNSSYRGEASIDIEASPR